MAPDRKAKKLERVFDIVGLVEQSRSERTWRTPASTRHVWVAGGKGHFGPPVHPLEPPVQGLLACWRRRSYQWEALVIVIIEAPTAAGSGPASAEEEGVIMQRWVPAADLRPVPADPNRAFGAR